MKKTVLFYSLFVYILLAIFFIGLHPIAIFDTDDWSFIHHLRLPIPIIHAWNPIKVFPEVFMSVFSYAGAYILYPITGRYCFSLSISNGLFICFTITIYFLEFLLLIEKKFSLSAFRNIMISIIFICLHFLIVAHYGSSNVFLFYSYDLTCIYHYTLSTIINAALVMHMIRNDGFNNYKNLSKRHRILIFVWTYLAIFSNLYTNVIISVYVGVELLFTLIYNCRNYKFNLKEYCKNNRPLLIIIIIWFCSLAIESTGGRSEGHEMDFIQSLGSSFKNTAVWFERFNPIFLFFAVATIILWGLKIKNKNFITLCKYILAFALTLLYLILLSSVVNNTYVARIDVIFAAFFWLLLIIMLLFCMLIVSFKNSSKVLFALSAVLSIATIYVSDTFKEINYNNLPYPQCEALVDNIISQFKTAEENGETELNLIVPAFDDERNWPYGTFAAEHFTKVMFRHRITHNKIVVVKMIPDEKMTKKYITIKSQP